MRRAVPVVALALAIVPPVPAGAQDARIVARDDAFEPADLRLPVGVTVTFVNEGTNPHTVTADDGSGLVHMAPAFGADDFQAGIEHELALVRPVAPDGHAREWGLPLMWAGGPGWVPLQLSPPWRGCAACPRP